MRSPLIAMVALLPSASDAAGFQVWKVAAAPVMDVRGTTDAGEVVFGNVAWATRLNDGTVVLADAATPAVQFIASTGSRIKSVGRAGSGPGDLRLPTWVGQCAVDTAFVWDFPAARMTTYSASGVRGRTFTFGMRGGEQTRAACDSAGHLLQFGTPRRLSSPASADPNATFRVLTSAAAPIVIGRGGDTLSKLPDVQVGEIIAGMIGGRAGGMPLSYGATVALGSGRAFVGIPDSATIGIFTLDARRVATIRVDAPPRRPRKAQFERAIDDIVALFPAETRRLARDWALATPMPPRLPAFTEIFADPRGIVWAVLTAPGDADTRIRGFREDGTVVADLTVPRNLKVFEIGTDFILGGYADADDEAHVVVYRVVRGRP